MSKDNYESLEELVDRISFRLLATRKHPNYEWLKEEIKEYLIKKNKNGNK